MFKGRWICGFEFFKLPVIGLRGSAQTLDLHHCVSWVTYSMVRKIAMTRTFQHNR